MTTVSFYIINLFNMELYPTCLRQSGMSLGNVFSSGASALGPYIVYIVRIYNSQTGIQFIVIDNAIRVLSHKYFIFIYFTL